MMEFKLDIPKTLNEFLEETAAKYGDRPAVCLTGEAPTSYREFYQQVLSVADLLSEKGVSRGDRVAILGENLPQWGIAYFAILKAGGIAVPILPDFPESDIRHILTDSEAKVIFTTQKQLEKVGDLGRGMLKHIITLDDFETKDQALDVQPISQILDRAVEFIKKIPETIGLKSRDVGPDDVASIIYTSGTSGHSKAVMLTHLNFLSNAYTMNNLIDIGENWTFLSMLPLSHSYEFTVGFLLALLTGSRIVYLGKPPTPSILEKVCPVEKPNAICTVPLILEKIYKKKVLIVLEKNTLVKMITRIPGLKKKIYKKINDKLMAFFGGELVVMAIGGAPFNSEAERFFRTAGFPYLIGYGLTETAPLLAGGPHGDPTIKVTSTGKPIPGVEIRIENPDPKTGIGEIYARGPNIMKGYLNNPDLTREVLDGDGWFKTGDLGRFDKLNNLYITGRSKNLILMANGENIYPEEIEAKINANVYVAESLVIENNNLLEAWIYLDYDLVDRDTKGKTEKQRNDFIEMVLKDLRQTVNEQMSSFSKISRMFEQKEPFEKTATMKIKRYLYTHK
jgi:long-chain acyl-CoA synthetase